MGEYADLREQLRTEYVEVVSRKMFTVTGEKPDTDAVERMIETIKEIANRSDCLTAGGSWVNDDLPVICAARCPPRQR